MVHSRLPLNIILLITILVSPLAAYAAPLCSDGSPAPAGNICNCASTFSIGGSNFTPGTGSSLTQNTYGGSGGGGLGMSFSGVGGALASCLNIGGSIMNSANNLFKKSGLGGKTGGKGGAGSAGAVRAVPTNDKTTQSNTQTAAEEEQKTTQREQCLNGAAYAVAKTALQKLSDKTLNWVKTGFNGNPFYVRNIDSYMKSIENEKLDQYLNKYISSDTNPIFGNAIKSVLKKETTGWTDGYLNKVMNTPEAQKYQKFQDDFTQGGWGTFLDMKNNPVGAYFNATQELADSVDKAQENTTQELTQGNGFLDMKKCAEYEQPKQVAPTNYGGIAAGSCSYITPANQSTCCSVAAEPTNHTQCAAYLGGYQGPAPTPTINTTTPSLSTSKLKCIRYETVTPGALISQQVSGITKSTIDQLVNADKINEVLGSFFDQLMNKLFSDGLTGTGRGSSKATTGGGMGTNTVLDSHGNTLPSAGYCQTPLGYDPTTGGFDQEFDISRPQQLRAVILTQKNFLTRMQDAQFVMNKFVPRLGALDYCIPGPNPTYNNNLNENAQTFISQLQQLMSNGDTGPSTTDIIHAFLDPGGFTNQLGCTLFGCDDDPPYVVGYLTKRVSLFDKIDQEEKPIKDRAYTSGATQDMISVFFSDILKQLKALIVATYNDQDVIDAFASTTSTPADHDLAVANIKESIKETTNIVDYAQGVASYNDYYNQTIQDTQDAITELQAIDTEVERIVGQAKHDYILNMANAGTPVNTTCLDNAYQLGTVPAGVAHLENITAAPDWFMTHSADSSQYFYNNL